MGRKVKKMYVVSAPMDIQLPFGVKHTNSDGIHGYLPVFTDKAKAKKFCKKHKTEFLEFDVEYKRREEG